MYVDGMHPDVASVADEATSTDPAVGLAGVASLRDLLDTLERLQVENARARGWAWQRIADALGVSKQAVHKKHGGGLRFRDGGR